MANGDRHHSQPPILSLLGTITSHLFEWFFPQPQVVSLFIGTGQYSARYCGATLCFLEFNLWEFLCSVPLSCELWPPETSKTLTSVLISDLTWVPTFLNDSLEVISRQQSGGIVGVWLIFYSFRITVLESPNVLFLENNLFMCFVHLFCYFR